MAEETKSERDQVLKQEVVLTKAGREVTVSTVDLGVLLVAGFREHGGNIETMVFDSKDGAVVSWSDLDCARSDDPAGWESQHNAMVAKWREGGVL